MGIERHIVEREASPPTPLPRARGVKREWRNGWRGNGEKQLKPETKYG